MIEIDITTRKQLDIYMNVQRQKILKTLAVNDTPMTPKQLSVILNISASSVTYHLKKLKEIGLVEVDHTEKIHGIQANYYRRIPATINLKGNLTDDLQEEKITLADYALHDIWKDFKEYVANNSSTDETNTSPLLGDFHNGIFYLTDEEALELKELISRFGENHFAPEKGKKPWEIALIAFPK